MADLKQKEMIFGLMEVIFGLATVFTLSSAGLLTDKWGTNFGCLFGCSGALVPLMMRFSLRYFNGSGLSKVPEMMVMIWAMALYYVGGILIIIVRQDKLTKLSDMHYMPASFAIVVAIICTVDFIVGLVGK